MKRYKVDDLGCYIGIEYLGTHYKKDYKAPPQPKIVQMAPPKEEDLNTFTLGDDDFEDKPKNQRRYVKSKNKKKGVQ